jgi:hypothetical protein
MAGQLPDIGDIAGALDLAARTLSRKADIQKQIKLLKDEELAIDRVLRATWGKRIDDMHSMMAAFISSIRLPEDVIDDTPGPVEPYDQATDQDVIADEPEDAPAKVDPEGE